MVVLITFILKNFPLVCLAFAFFLSAFLRKNRSYFEALTRFCLLLPVGFAGIWGFYYHAFMPELSAKSIGWATSPFQFEVAVANLGMGLAGVIGFFKGRDFALAVAITVTVFLWGAAWNHIQQILFQSNFSPGNSGSILITDLVIPKTLWIGYLFWKKTSETQ